MNKLLRIMNNQKIVKNKLIKIKYSLIKLINKVIKNKNHNNLCLVKTQTHKILNLVILLLKINLKAHYLIKIQLLNLKILYLKQIVKFNHKKVSKKLIFPKYLYLVNKTIIKNKHNPYLTHNNLNLVLIMTINLLYFLI